MNVKSDSSARWLDPVRAAAYISVRVDHLPRLVRAGKIPAPSYHLGPRKARYDRLRIDAMFGQAEVSEIEAIKESARAAFKALLESRPRRRRRDEGSQG